MKIVLFNYSISALSKVLIEIKQLLLTKRHFPHTCHRPQKMLIGTVAIINGAACEPN